MKNSTNALKSIAKKTTSILKIKIKNKSFYFKVCDLFSILHLDYIHKEKYRIDLSFINLEEETNSFEITNYVFNVKLYLN